MELGGAGLGPASLLTRPSVIRARPVATGPVSAPHITPGHHQPDTAGENILYRKWKILVLHRMHYYLKVYIHCFVAAVCKDRK